MLPSVFTVCSVCRFVSPGVHASNFIILSFIRCRLLFFRCRFPSLLCLRSQTLNCSKSLENTAVKVFVGVFLEYHCLAHVDRFGSPPTPLFFSLQQTACLSEATCCSVHLRSDIMTCSGKLAWLLLWGGENAHLLSTAGLCGTA